MKSRQTYVREGSSSYMIVEVDEEHMLHEWEVQMLMNNKILGLIPFERRVIDQIQYYYYNITSMQPLHRVFEKRLVSEQELRKIIQTIRHLFTNIQQYILDTRWIQMRPSEVYINMQKFQPAFIYMPIKDSQDQSRIQLAEFFLEKVNHGDSQAIILSYGFYRIIKQDSYDASQITELLDAQNEAQEKQNNVNLDMEKEVTDRQENMLMHEVETQDILFHEQLEIEENKPKKSNKQKVSHLCTGIIPVIALGFILYSGICVNSFTGEWNYINIAMVSGVSLLLFLASNIYLMNSREIAGEAGDMRSALEEKECQYNVEKQEKVLSKSPEEDLLCEVTSVLDYLEASQYILKSMQEKDKNVVIENWPFTIGTFYEGIDCRLKNNTVSKFHARLNKIDGKVFIQDLNSTNGTFINGVKILDDKPHEICDYDYIDFGGEKFIYRIKLGD